MNERKKLTLIVKGFDLSCLESVFQTLKTNDAATAMTIATAEDIVKNLRLAYDAAKPYTKKDVYLEGA